MNLNEYFEKELEKRVARAEALLAAIKEAGIEYSKLKNEISVLNSVLTTRRNQQ